MTDPTDSRDQLEIVICTYDNAPMLDRTLSALGGQRPAQGPWSVLVVDNNSSDETGDVIHATSLEAASNFEVCENRFRVSPPPACGGCTAQGSVDRRCRR